MVAGRYAGGAGGRQESVGGVFHRDAQKRVGSFAVARKGLWEVHELSQSVFGEGCEGASFCE